MQLKTSDRAGLWPYPILMNKILLVVIIVVVVLVLVMELTWQANTIFPAG
jgi:hypothetical protein